MNHFALASFWHRYHALPPAIRELADKNFALLRADPRQPSLQFKRIGPYWSARVGRNYRAVATEEPEGFIWFWIGPHEEYKLLLKRQ